MDLSDLVCDVIKAQNLNSYRDKVRLTKIDDDTYSIDDTKHRIRYIDHLNQKEFIIIVRAAVNKEDPVSYQLDKEKEFVFKYDLDLTEFNIPELIISMINQLKETIENESEFLIVRSTGQTKTYAGVTQKIVNIEFSDGTIRKGVLV